MPLVTCLTRFHLQSCPTPSQRRARMTTTWRARSRAHCPWLPVAVVFAIQSWLAETPEQKRTSSTPAYFQVGMSKLLVHVPSAPAGQAWASIWNGSVPCCSAIVGCRARKWCVAGSQVATVPCNCIIRHPHRASDDTCRLARNAPYHLLAPCVTMSSSSSFIRALRSPYRSALKRRAPPSTLRHAQTTAGLAFLSRRIPHLFLSACSTLQTHTCSLPTCAPPRPNHPNSTLSTRK
ncbi:hypothetical protein IG631_21647 [Alternaria alternata]|nr:hypothetical protein IG631_21647 [Alternaria alternata]